MMLDESKICSAQLTTSNTKKPKKATIFKRLCYVVLKLHASLTICV